MRSFPRPKTLQRSKPLQQAQTANASVAYFAKTCTEMTPCCIHQCRPQLMFHATLIKFDILKNNSRSTVRSVPEWPWFGVGEGSLGGCRYRDLPDMVRRAESTQAPEVVMGQMRSLHCEGQSFSSWEQSNTGIKSHIFRVM